MLMADIAAHRRSITSVSPSGMSVSKLARFDGAARPHIPAPLRIRTWDLLPLLIRQWRARHALLRMAIPGTNERAVKNPSDSASTRLPGQDKRHPPMPIMVYLIRCFLVG